MRWHCFAGCGGGDAIDYVMQRYGLDFKAACCFLGLEPGRLSRTDRTRIQKRKQKRKAAETFRKWELSAIGELCRMINKVSRMSAKWKTVNDLEREAGLLHFAVDWQGQLDVLMMGSESERRGIYRRWKQRGYF